MIPRECKRLAEVDFPIAEVSRHAAREKSIRHGHPSTLHLWWARRPLASSRAVLLALLLPDPCDAHCPEAFKEKARQLLPSVGCGRGETDEMLRQGLLKFIANFANWNNAADRTFLDVSRALVKAAHGEEPPLVVDPFAGGGSIPLMRSFWLCKKAKRKRALRHRVERCEGEPPSVEFEVFEPNADREVRGGTVTRARATCLCCGAVLPPERVRAQLAAQRGGADVIFDAEGRRTGGARMTAVVTLKAGRHYRLPTDADYAAVRKAQERVAQVLEEWERGGKQGLCPVPDEPTPAGGGSGAGRAFSVQRYGMMQWGDLFTARQKVALAALGRALQTRGAVTRPLSLSIGKLADLANTACPWEPVAECPRNVLKWSQN